MIGAATPCALATSLLDRLPGAKLALHQRQEWHSLTFTGERHVIQLRLETADARRQAERFAAALPEVEFTLPRRFVADILVSRIVETAGGVEITVEALVLEE
jgi:hypothetical protein